MKKYRLLLLIFIVSIVVKGQNNEINQLIINSGKYNKINDENSIIDNVPKIENGYRCNYITKKYSKSFDNFITFSDLTDLYPGSIVQGKYLNDGDLISIGNFKRQPISLIINGLDVNSKIIENPDKSTITDALKGMVREYKGNTQINYEFQYAEAYSKKQALFDLGINAKWLSGSIGNNFEVSTNSQEHSIYIYFKQVYYTVSIDYPTNPSIFFANDVNIEDLKLRINENNKPGYVSSIKYGRIIIAKMTSSYSIDEMKNAAKAKFVGGLIKTNIDYESENILKSCNWEIKVSGGVTNEVPTDVSGVISFINSGMNFNSSTQGVPIAYEVRYLSDNTPFYTADDDKYTIKECDKKPMQAKFKVFFKDIYVIADCENTFTRGGEFFYKFKVNENLILYKGGNSIGDYIVKSPGQSIDFYTPYEITIDFAQGNFLNIYGEVTEYDTPPPHDYLGDFTKTFYFPFNELPINQTLSFEKILSKSMPGNSNYCKVKVNYEVTRLE